jgi:hypothetical protein
MVPVLSDKARNYLFYMKGGQRQGIQDRSTLASLFVGSQFLTEKAAAVMCRLKPLDALTARCPRGVMSRGRVELSFYFFFNLGAR